MRSRKGQANWHTGQEILKNAATTGPRPSREVKEQLFPSRSLRAKPGAIFPARIVVINPSLFARCQTCGSDLHGKPYRIRESPPNREPASVNVACLPAHVVHQEILAEREGRREIGFAAAHLRDFLDKMNKAVIACEHEGVDEYPRPLA